MKIIKSKWFWFSVICIVGLVWWFFVRESEVVYDMEEVRRGDVVEEISISGVLEPFGSVDVSFELTGTIRSLYGEKGESVMQGDVLARIDDSVLQAQRKEAILAVETAVQSEWLARRNWDNLKKEEREMKKLASESARASLATLEKNISRTILRAPVSGEITRKYVEVGEVVTTASPVFQIVTEESGVYVEADVPESDVSKLFVGQGATVTFDALTKEDIFPAKIDFIDPRSTVISDVVYYRTRFLLERGESRLKTGMSADVVVETGRSNEAISLSRRAIKEDDGGLYVEVYENGEKSRRDIKIGIENDEGDVEILGGLSEGERVILEEKK